MGKLIITAAVTGGMTVPSQSHHLPITPEEIISDAVACAKAGAAAVHIHARDPNTGAPSADVELFGEIISGIKMESDVVVGITTGGGAGMTPEERLRPIPVYAPEMASFNLGSINFTIHPVARHFEKADDYRFDWEQEYVHGTKGYIFSNTFRDMEIFAQTMCEHDTKPEFEAYDLGHLDNLAFLERSGFVKPPYWIQFVLGVIGGLRATPENLITMKQSADRLFGAENYRWSVVGVGSPAEFHMAAMAMIMGGHVRVGLEDNVVLTPGVLATNVELVEKIVRWAGEFGREIATPGDARELLALKGLDAVTY